MRRVVRSCLVAVALVAGASCSGSTGSEGSTAASPSTSSSSTTIRPADTGEAPATYPAAWDVPFRTLTVPEVDLERGTVDYPAGTTFPPQTRPLPCDVTVERNLEVILRDGTILRTDVVVPTGSTERLPAIVSWSPYGKDLPTGAPPSVAADRFSGLGKLEGPDAAFWVCHGYALVNPDSRGSFASDGDLMAFGSIDAGDGAEVVEWAAAQDWSNGKVGLAGNSWLAISQWSIAAARPPHLAAIAPWNGFDDFHRDLLFQGGIPDLAFARGTTKSLIKSRTKVEDPVAVMERDPLRSDYWEDKRADLAAVEVPAYVVADGATTLHKMGTFDAFRRLGSDDTWLRVNDTDEWHDQYLPENEEDLLRFFDRYLKGIDNGWEDTPKVRVSIMDPNGSGRTDTTNTPYADYPVPGTEYRKLYLGDDATLGSTAPASTSSVSYDSAAGSTTFTITFDEDTTLVGYPKARLYASAEEADDIDLFVLVEKLDADGTPLVPSDIAAQAYFPAPPPGSPGRLRVSMRATDPELSTDFNPVYALSKAEPIEPGEVVAVDVAILPISMRWHAGQQLRFTIAGRPIRDDAISDDLATINRGATTVHVGGATASYLQLPVVAS